MELVKISILNIPDNSRVIIAKDLGEVNLIPDENIILNTEISGALFQWVDEPIIVRVRSLTHNFVEVRSHYNDYTTSHLIESMTIDLNYQTKTNEKTN